MQMWMPTFTYKKERRDKDDPFPGHLKTEDVEHDRDCVSDDNHICDTSPCSLEEDDPVQQVEAQGAHRCYGLKNKFEGTIRLTYQAFIESMATPCPKQALIVSSHFTFTKHRILVDANTLRSEERRVGKECRSRW